MEFASRRVRPCQFSNFCQFVLVFAALTTGHRGNERPLLGLARTAAIGTSRHFVALRNLVAMGGIADIDQARFMSTRPGAVGTTANAGRRPLADSYQPTLDASTTTLVLIPTRS